MARTFDHCSVQPMQPLNLCRRCDRFGVQLADWITELKLGNGTSVLIFTNIVSALPTSIGGAIQQVHSPPPPTPQRLPLSSKAPRVRVHVRFEAS